MEGMCLYNKDNGADNEITDTADQFIHIRLFLVVNIRMTNYYVVAYVPTYTLATHDILVQSCKHGHLLGESTDGVICFSGVYDPTSVNEIS